MPFGIDPAAWETAGTLLCGSPRAAVVRSALLPQGQREVRLRCERSMPFEFVSEFMQPFASLWGARIETIVSDYDPSLSGARRAPLGEDVLLLWVDWRLHTHLDPRVAARWIRSVISEARVSAARPAPVLVNDWPLGCGVDAGRDGDAWATALASELRTLSADVADCHVLSLENLRARECLEFFDSRNDAVAHFPFSQRAAIHIARHLGAQVLPSLLTPRLKAVVVDLDNTLWQGVLGEDGPDGLGIGPGHQALHAELTRLAQAGLMLAICSRNDRRDVEALFASGRVPGLSLRHFAAVRADWGSNAANLASIATELNVLPSALLFVDDNPVELAEVARAVPEVELLLANSDGARTAEMLARHPGLYRLRPDTAAAVRTADLRASQEREQLRAAAANPDEYLASLRMVIDIFENCREHAPRIHELSNKTNQFNLCVARLSEAQVQEALGEGHLVVTVHVRDYLADSGIVAVLLFRIAGVDAVMTEFLLSCRAFGRRIEHVALRWAIRRLRQLGCERLLFEAREAPRNQPALEFLQRLIPDGGRSANAAELEAVLNDLTRNHPAEVRIRQPT